MESHPQQQSIAHIPVDSLIWSQQESISDSRQVSPLQIYTVSKNIKNPQILQHIKPDYGSLGQFMKNVAISKDILMHNRKKKNELQDDLQQKKMRLALKDKNLDKVVKHPNATPLEKTIASKMIVENLFYDKFGTTLQNFALQTNKPQNNNLSYSSIAQLTAIFDELMTKNEDESIARYNDLKHETPVIVRNKRLISSKEVKVLSFDERYQKLKRIQKNYLSLKKQAPFELVQNAGTANQNSFVYQSFTISQNISSFNLLAPQLVKVDISKVQSLKIINIKLAFDIFSALLDFFTDQHCYALKQILVINSNLGNTQRVAQRIKEFIQNSSVQKVQLCGMGINSRDFCVICLGVGARSSFGMLSMRDNNVGEIARKCLDVLLKFNKQVKIDLSNNPIEREIRGGSMYTRCFF